MDSTMGSWVGWAVVRLRLLVREIGRRRRERAMVSALGALDDGMLKDIGVYRCEIPSLARQRWRGAEGG